MIKNEIRSEDQLRKIIPSYPAMLDKRILTAFDNHCIEFMTHCSSFVLGWFNDKTQTFGFAVAGADNRITRINEQWLELELQQDTLEGVQSVQASLYCLIPNIGHGLRVNGVLKRSHGGYVFKIETTYMHCSRAVVRGGLWQSPERNPSNASVSDATFGMILTLTKEGKTELSPRGDITGVISILEESEYLMVERPGNKVAVSLRNVIATQKAAVLAVDTASEQLHILQGRCGITADDILLSQYAVSQNKKVTNKPPKIGFVLQDPQVEEMPWPKGAFCCDSGEEPVEIARFSTVLSDHMNGRGVMSKLSQPIVSAVIAYDLKHLY